MKVRAIQPHPYDGIHRNAGDEYEMQDSHVEIMTLYGNVVPVHFPQNRIIDPKSYISRRDLQVETKPSGYKRRDLKAR